MDSVITTIEAKLHGLRQQLAESEDLVQTHRTRIERISAQIETLCELRAELADSTSAIAREQASHTNQSVQSNGEDRLRPSDAVIALLTERSGLGAQEIIDFLEHRVDTSAKNIRHNIRTTLFNLVRRGALVRDRQKRYRIAESSEE